MLKKILIIAGVLVLLVVAGYFLIKRAADNQVDIKLGINTARETLHLQRNNYFEGVEPRLDKLRWHCDVSRYLPDGAEIGFSHATLLDGYLCVSAGFCIDNLFSKHLQKDSQPEHRTVVMLVDVNSGKLVGQWNILEEPISSFTTTEHIIDEAKLYARGASNKEWYCIDPRMPASRKLTQCPNISARIIDKAYITYKDFYSERRSAHHQNMQYILDWSKTPGPLGIAAFDKNKQQKWQIKLENFFALNMFNYTHVLLDERQLYVQSWFSERDSELNYCDVYAFDLFSGELKWHKKYQGHALKINATDYFYTYFFEYTMACVGKELYVPTPDGAISCLDTAKGEVLWNTRVGRIAELNPKILASGNNIYGVAGDTLYKLDRSNGKLLQSLALSPQFKALVRGCSMRIIGSSHGLLFLNDMKGNIYAVE